MIVTYDIFSGKPNPTFELGENEIGHLKNTMAGMPTMSEAATIPPEGLGYRGFTFTLDDVKYVVYDDTIQAGSIYLKDNFKFVEDFLLARVPD